MIDWQLMIWFLHSLVVIHLCRAERRDETVFSEDQSRVVGYHSSANIFIHDIKIGWKFPSETTPTTFELSVGLSGSFNKKLAAFTKTESEITHNYAAKITKARKLKGWLPRTDYAKKTQETLMPH